MQLKLKLKYTAILIAGTLSMATASASSSCESNGQVQLNGECVEWTDVFDVENGLLDENDFLISTDPIQMKFSALDAQVVTPNGHGWRHELKVKKSERVAMTEVYELFKATIKVDLSNGAKVIVAQHHSKTTDTITKLYVADIEEGGYDESAGNAVPDNIQNNGIFDVYIRLAKADGDGETKHLLTTISSGDSFNFEEENDHGVITVKINGIALDPITVADDSESFFKFGNYHQAESPEDSTHHYTHSEWPEFYAENYETSDITFTNVSYIRTVD